MTALTRACAAAQEAVPYFTKVIIYTPPRLLPPDNGGGGEGGGDGGGKGGGVGGGVAPRAAHLRRGCALRFSCMEAAAAARPHAAAGVARGRRRRAWTLLPSRVDAAMYCICVGCFSVSVLYAVVFGATMVLTVKL